MEEWQYFKGIFFLTKKKKVLEKSSKIKKEKKTNCESMRSYPQIRNTEYFYVVENTKEIRTISFRAVLNERRPSVSR